MPSCRRVRGQRSGFASTGCRSARGDLSVAAILIRSGTRWRSPWPRSIRATRFPWSWTTLMIRGDLKRNRAGGPLGHRSAGFRAGSAARTSLQRIAASGLVRQIRLPVHPASRFVRDGGSFTEQACSGGVDGLSGDDGIFRAPTGMPALRVEVIDGQRALTAQNRDLLVIGSPQSQPLFCVLGQPGAGPRGKG